MKQFFLLFLCLSIFTAKGNDQPDPSKKPKLVVGIVIDQMRQEYLYRYFSKFGEKGFKRLIGEGFMLENAHYNYIPTYTGPGHASIYTGATPAGHGIVGNSWYDRKQKQIINCVEDKRYRAIGADKGHGAVSPKRLMATTITDELKLSTQSRAKVISLSFKDRAAVLPGGHTPDGAYWYDKHTGKFITSSYYVEELPSWVKQFNELELADKYLNKTWNTVYPIEQYEESNPDDSPYESMGENIQLFFPYPLQKLRKEYGEFELLPLTPFGNDLLTQLAFAALDGEHMGNDEWTDFLAISYSSTDILGHAMGPHSVELEDMYIRLDKNLEHLLNKLDKDIGKNQYLVFITADHGVADVEGHVKDLRIVPREYQPIHFEDSLANYLAQYPLLETPAIENITNRQIYLDPLFSNPNPQFLEKGYHLIPALIKSYLLQQVGVADVFTSEDLQAGCFDERSTRGMVKRGIYNRRSGDIAFVMEQGWTGNPSMHGTTHGTGYTYDTHVPIIFYGYGVHQGSTAAYHPITDIAPTLSVLLRIKTPSNTTGNPITELVDK